MLAEGSAATGSRPQTWEIGEGADDAADPRVSEILGVLAHEFRNPLASLQGCAQTLVQRGEQLPEDTRRGLAEVIAAQSQRMDWLIRAAAAFGGVGGGRLEEIDLAQVATEAAEFASVPFDGGGGTIWGDPTLTRLAIESVLLALAGPSTRLQILEPGTRLRVTTPDADLEQGSRRWKLQLAARLVRRDGGRVIAERSADGIRVDVVFGE